MAEKIYCSSGGGVRIGATWGAQLAGEKQAAFHWSMFQWFVGTSAGALDAALTANHWSPSRKIALFEDTDFGKLFSPALIPFGLRKALALKWPISLRRLADFFDGLGLAPMPGLLINTVDAEANRQIVYCEAVPPWWPPNSKIQIIDRAFSSLGFGKILTRSMVLPGLVADETRYMDGGIAENPMMSALPQEADILLMHLGYAGDVRRDGDTTPKSLIDRSLYAYEFKAKTLADHMAAHFPKIKIIRPGVYDVDPSEFSLSREEKKRIVEAGYRNTLSFW